MEPFAGTLTNLNSVLVVMSNLLMKKLTLTSSAGISLMFVTVAVTNLVSPLKTGVAGSTVISEIIRSGPSTKIEAFFSLLE